MATVHMNTENETSVRLYGLFNRLVDISNYDKKHCKI